jgi:uncharacterized protein (DUF302 family)
MVSAVPHPVTRLVFHIDASFDDFRDRYERAVPTIDLANLVELSAGFSTWDALVERTAELAPHGFLIYGRIDVHPLMSLAGHRSRCIEYLMGNHVIAETMFRHDPGIMLYAPLRTLLYEDLEGRTHFAIDQPSTRFASFGHDDIAATGRTLDQKLAALLVALDVPVPEVMGGSPTSVDAPR